MVQCVDSCLPSEWVLRMQEAFKRPTLNTRPLFGQCKEPNIYQICQCQTCYPSFVISAAQQ